MEWSWKVRVASVLVLMSSSIALPTAGPITEAEAVRVFINQSPRARQVPLVEQSVDAALRIEARVANPEFNYQIEDAAGVRDEFLTFQQELPITGRRELLGRRAAAAAASAGLAAKRDLLADLYDLKRSFYELLYSEIVFNTVQDGIEQLERIVEILEIREREGEGSGYDLLRAEQELAELVMTAARTEVDHEAARARFGSFYEPDLNMREALLEGDLAPAGPVPEVEQAIMEAVTQRLDLHSLLAGKERLDLERKAARRIRFPEPTLTAGWKRTTAVGLSDSGYVAGVMVPLPVFNRGRLAEARAKAEGERTALEAEILVRRIRSEVQTAVAREQAARGAAREYGEGAGRRGDELRRIARLRYDEGESGVLELLDAHRTSLTMQLRALAARYEAKIAEIDREHVTGNEVHP